MDTGKKLVIARRKGWGIGEIGKLIFLNLNKLNFKTYYFTLFLYFGHPYKISFDERINFTI